MTQVPAGPGQDGAADRLAPGYALAPLDLTVTQDMIDRYADATGDHNPIHVDPDYARNGPFGRTIAHGLMTLAHAARMLNAWSDGAFDRCGEIDVVFTGPVFVGETIRMTARVERLDAEGAACCTLSCAAGDRLILAGTVRLPIQRGGES